MTDIIYYDPDYKFPDYFDPDEPYDCTDEDFADDKKMKEINEACGQQSLRDDLCWLEKLPPLLCGCKGRFYNYDGENMRECVTIRTKESKEEQICVECARSLGHISSDEDEVWKKADKKLYEWQKDEFEEFWMIKNYGEFFFRNEDRWMPIVKENSAKIFGINMWSNPPYITAQKVHNNYEFVFIAYDVETDEFRLK
tara:strand:- start:1934 stop:2524 length:591 start_codon:yes stop_codon:yes gene_type:complete